MIERLNFAMLAVYAVTLICMVIFVLIHKHIQKRDTADAKNIFWILVLIVAGMIVDRIYWLCDPAWRSIEGDKVYLVMEKLESFLYLAREVLVLLIIVCWNRFVDYVVYRSFDHVKKKYKRAIVPALIISAVLIGVRLLSSPAYRSINAPLNYVLDWLGFACYVLEFYYVANAVWIAWESTKERKAPTFLRMDVFVIPLIVGFLFNYLVLFLPEGVSLFGIQLYDWLGFDSRFPFLLLAAVLTWRTVEKRYRYMDPANGFYNKDFLFDMNSYMEKNGYPNGVGVYFQSPGSEGKLIPVLNQQKPADAEIFSVGEDAYLLMAGPQKESVLRLLVKSVELGLAEADASLKVKSAYAVREKDESTEAFTKRLLGMHA